MAPPKNMNSHSDNSVPTPRSMDATTKLGCIIAIVVTPLLLVFGCCIGGWYALFHSSMPLSMMESMIESSGEVEVERLRGSISSGFEMQSLSFRSADNHWSKLENIAFKFNGVWDVMNNNRLIIEDLNVERGVIYADLEQSDLVGVDEDLHVDDHFNDEWDDQFVVNSEVGFDGDWNDVESEIRRQQRFNQNYGGQGEVRIDRVRVANLKIVDLKTGTEMSLDQIEFDGFHAKDGRILNLGQLTANTDHVDIDSLPSELFADMDESVQVTGTIRESMGELFLQDIPFVVDLGVEWESVYVEMNLFDDQVCATGDSDGQFKVEMHKFSPTRFIQYDRAIIPTDIEAIVTSNDVSRGYQISPGGTFKLGTSHFHFVETDPLLTTDDSAVEPTEPSAEAKVTADTAEASISDEQVAGSTTDDNGNNQNREPIKSVFKKVFPAVASVDGQTVVAQIRITEWFPFMIVRLRSDWTDDPQKLWAATVYGREFANLEKAEQKIIERSIVRSMPRPAAAD